ncbi:coiled-coil domain-containing protein [Paenibacillus sp. FSL L8-0689]|uniref:coiled-coil domain-containing protein n=1 Tax=Paenibacillus sp. FSL L8-0689 TaxID=2921607 RepID=UPI0030F802E1
MNKRIKITISTLLSTIMLLTFIYVRPTLAAPSQEESQILQDSLSIVEIDHEIERISQEQKTLLQRQQELRSNLTVQQEQMTIQRKRAGSVLRSYYMGERDKLLSVVLGAKSIRQLLSLYDYYLLLISHDQDVLQEYESNYQSMRKTEQQVIQASMELETVKTNLLAQRKRIVLLQSRVNDGVSASNDPDTLRKLIGEMTAYWENVGVYEVNKHFKALAQAMQDLPQFIQQQQGAMVTNGKVITISIREEDFNRFLKSENELFNHFNFTFAQDQIMVEGQQGTMKLRVEGHYTVENEPKNAILFHVDRLVFNGLELPDTTRNKLERDFDLGFYPQQLISYVKATEVRTLAGMLEVKLELNFK